jgi:heterodisulfide reductase subunit C
MSAAALQPAELFGDFASQVDPSSHAGLSRCLQCKKCTSGCPVSARADRKPHELVRLVQLGQRESVLSSRMIWECTSCHTCGTRCPQNVDIAAMNDALRRMSRSTSMVHVRTVVPTFDRHFLRAIRRRGRIYELGLLAFFKLATLRLFDDVGKFFLLLFKGKISLLPRRRVGARPMKRLFSHVEQSERAAPSERHEAG